MRTLSDTLRAAQRATPQVPRVRCLIRDRQPRILPIGDEGPSDCQVDMCETGDGKLVVVMLDTSGVVRAKRVTAPGTWGQSGDWDDSWTTVESAAYPWHQTPSGDCGDVCISNNNGTLRIFYISAGGDDIKVRESADHGASWGSASYVLQTGYRQDQWWLASSGHDDCWWTNTDHKDVRLRLYYGSSWEHQKDFQGLEECAAWNNFGGLSVIKAGSKGYVFAALWDSEPSDGRIIVLEHEWGETPDCKEYAPWKVMPAIRGNAFQGWCPLWPKVIATAEGLGQSYLLSFLERYTVGSTEMYNPVMLRSHDLDHWSNRIPIPFDTAYEHRYPMGAQGGRVYLYAAHEAAEMRHYDAEDSRVVLSVEQGDVLRYRIAERPDHGELSIEWDNRDGAYDGAGQAGQSAEALRPLAQVVVEQGLATASGDERVACRPFYLWRTERHRQPGANWLRLFAMDGWQLFRLWRPQAQLVCSSQTLKWCIEELAARVGFFQVAFDDEDDWDETIASLTLDGDDSDWSAKRRRRAWQRWVPMNDDEVIAFDDRTTGYTLLQTLLSLVGGAVRWGHGDDTEVLYCFIPENQGQDPAADHTYEDGEILEGRYTQELVWPTRARCSGTDKANEALDNAAGGANGREFVTFIRDAVIQSAEWCLQVAEGAIDDGQARSCGGQIVTRPNAGLELHDIVLLNDSKVGASGITSLKRRVNGIVTEYDPLNEVWRQRIDLEQV